MDAPLNEAVPMISGCSNEPLTLPATSAVPSKEIRREPVEHAQVQAAVDIEILFAAGRNRDGAIERKIDTSASERV
jgi:hypothetical protein